MPVIAKKKSKKKQPIRKKMTEAQLVAAAEKALEDFKASSEERYEQAMKVYKEQTVETQDALDRMIDLLCGIARRHMRVGHKHRVDEQHVFLLPDQVIKQNMTYMAVEILIDLAQMDIQVEAFKMPPNLCAVCKKEIKPKKKRKK